MHLSHDSDSIMELVQTPKMDNTVSVINDANTNAWLRRVFEYNIITLPTIKNHIVRGAQSVPNVNNSKLENDIFIHFMAHYLCFLQDCRILKYSFGHSDVSSSLPVLFYFLCNSSFSF